jgi:hypothetical protein
VLRAQAAAAPWIVLGLGVLMLAMFGGASVALASGSIAAKVHRLLASLPIPPLRTWIAARSRGFTGTDARLAALFRTHPLRLASACGLSLVAWSIESVETWLLLHLVGVPMPLATAFAFEASVSLLRSLAAFSPGGLGFQDAGYVAALAALGVPDAATAGAAFIVLKRAKELVWALAGYGSLALPDARGSAPARRGREGRRDDRRRRRHDSRARGGEAFGGDHGGAVLDQQVREQELRAVRRATRRELRAHRAGARVRVLANAREGDDGDGAPPRSGAARVRDRQSGRRAAW